MEELFARSWKELAFRGAISLLFGVLIVLWPGLTLMWLILLFAVFALAGGTISVITALKDGTRGGDRWLLFVLGIAALAAGTLALLGPALTAIMFVLIIGATAVANGLVEIIMGLRLRKIKPDEHFLLVSGIVSVLFGGAMLVFPGAGALALVWLISIYAIVWGLLQLILARQTYQWNSSGNFKDRDDMGQPGLGHDHLHHHMP